MSHRLLIMFCSMPILLFSMIGCEKRSTIQEAEQAPVSATVAEPARYVGDEACQSCHAEAYDAYQLSNHKRGFTRFNSYNAPERFDVNTTVYNELSDLHYDVFTSGDTLYQREYRLDDNGEMLHELVHAADYVIGSGNATRSYLMEGNGLLTEMPVTWYAEREYWEMSPGYKEANDRFSRKIILECLTCHNAMPTHDPGTQNRYTEIPDGISCERCHGPASSHVAYWADHEQLPVNERDPTIVNPAHLSRGAQMSNCQQCHLAGITVFKEGEDATTFRPGRELSSNKTVFVPEAHLIDPNWVGIDSHPLRLARSACYKESEMTCNTCHDPHQSAALLPDNYYNTKCQNCHSGSDEALATHTCARPGIESAEMVTAGDCISCHMQKGGTSDVPHVSFSDHWIRKEPGPPLDPDQAKTVFETREPIKLVGLQQEGRSGHLLEARTSDTALDALEKSVAYFNFYEQLHRLPEYLPIIVNEARRGLARGADHVEARIALARSLVTLDSVDTALGILQEAARGYPANHWVWFWTGSIQVENAALDAGIGALQRAVTLQPHFLEAQVKLSEALVRAGRLDEAQLQLEEIVRQDPLHQPRSWYNLGLVYLQQQQGIQAQDAFFEASRLDPDLLDAHIQLGTAYLQQKRMKEAERAFRSAIEADENNPAGYGSLALVFLQKGEPRKARQLLQTVLRLDPGNQAARSLMSQIP